MSQCVTRAPCHRPERLRRGPGGRLGARSGDDVHRRITAALKGVASSRHQTTKLRDGAGTLLPTFSAVLPISGPLEIVILRRQDGGRLLPGGGEFARCLAAEGAVWVLRVVVVPPGFDRELCARATTRAAYLFLVHEDRPAGRGERPRAHGIRLPVVGAPREAAQAAPPCDGDAPGPEIIDEDPLLAGCPTTSPLFGRSNSIVSCPTLRSRSATLSAASCICSSRCTSRVNSPSRYFSAQIRMSE